MPLPLIKLDQVIYRLERFKPWDLKNIHIFRSIEMPGRKSATISALDDHLDNPPVKFAIRISKRSNGFAEFILKCQLRDCQFILEFFLAEAGQMRMRKRM